MFRLPPSLILALVALPELLPAHAAQISVHGQYHSRTQLPGLLQPRQAAAGLASTSGLLNTGDISYHTTITLGGLPFDVLIDTGSSDLWVSARKFPNGSDVVDTGLSGGVSYATTEVRGPIRLATLDFAGFSVERQAFLHLMPGESDEEGEGLIGLGPNSGSTIFASMQKSLQGAAVLDRIFLQSPETPNYMTFLMGRTEDPTDLFSGLITIGEILPEYAAVLAQPHLPVVDVPVAQSNDQHIQILLDEDGLIGPDGNPIPLVTRVGSTANKKMATVVLDTGFSLPQLPKSAANAIYSQIVGAQLIDLPDIGPIWIVPCDREVNITLKFGGVSIPVHPLDASLDPILLQRPRINNSLGEECCLGTFQPFSFDPGRSNYDIILGMAFLRNVYMLIDYGDFIFNSNSSSTRGNPYVQFLSTTEVSEGHQDFVAVRLNGIDTTGDQALNAPYVNVTHGADNTNTADSGNSSSQKVIIGVVVGISILAVIALVICVWLWKKKQNRDYEISTRSRTHGTGPGSSSVGGGAGGVRFSGQSDRCERQKQSDRNQQPGARRKSRSASNHKQMTSVSSTMVTAGSPRASQPAVTQPAHRSYAQLNDAASSSSHGGVLSQTHHSPQTHHQHERHSRAHPNYAASSSSHGAALSSQTHHSPQAYQPSQRRSARHPSSTSTHISTATTQISPTSATPLHSPRPDHQTNAYSPSPPDPAVERFPYNPASTPLGYSQLQHETPSIALHNPVHGVSDTGYSAFGVGSSRLQSVHIHTRASPPTSPPI